jgi:hypothetical protein
MTDGGNNERSIGPFDLPSCVIERRERAAMMTKYCRRNIVGGSWEEGNPTRVTSTPTDSLFSFRKAGWESF